MGVALLSGAGMVVWGVLSRTRMGDAIVGGGGQGGGGLRGWYSDCLPWETQSCLASMDFPQGLDQVRGEARGKECWSAT